MVTTKDVLALISKQPIVENVDQELVSTCCEMGISYILERIRADVDPGSKQVLYTAAAMAEFYLALKKYSEIDLYDTYSVGDLTFRRDCEKEMNVAMEKMKLAISDASAILKDGGFYCGCC